jgi:predicted nuclease with TOPRIM domain
MSEVVKALKQKIDELENEKKVLMDENSSLRAEIESLNERILDLEASA